MGLFEGRELTTDGREEEGCEGDDDAWRWCLWERERCGA